MIRQPAAWILWVITWTIGWWIGNIGLYGVAVNEYYFGFTAPTWRSIQTNIQSYTLCWFALGMLQIISLHSYTRVWSGMLVLWLVGMSIVWGVWWASLLYFVPDQTFSLLFSIGWIILGCMQAIFIRFLFRSISISLLCMWIFGVLITGGSYVFIEHVSALVLFNLYFSGLVYGCITGYVLERHYVITESSPS